MLEKIEESISNNPNPDNGKQTKKNSIPNPNNDVDIHNGEHSSEGESDKENEWITVRGKKKY